MEALVAVLAVAVLAGAAVLAEACAAPVPAGAQRPVKTKIPAMPLAASPVRRGVAQERGRSCSARLLVFNFSGPPVSVYVSALMRQGGLRPARLCEKLPSANREFNDRAARGAPIILALKCSSDQ